MEYLSEEWKKDQWKMFEEEILGGDNSDCGGWTPDGPCGGCSRCMRMQFSYGLEQEEKRARTLGSTGLLVAPPNLISLKWFPGFLGGHDSYNCNMAGEREECSFPWEGRAV